MKSNAYQFQVSRRDLLGGVGLIVLGSIFPQNKELSSRQKSIIWGNILGDGHLQLSPNKKTTRLRFDHSEKQKEYVQWQFEQLDWLCERVSPPKIVPE